jgi:hypothetical protein
LFSPLALLTVSAVGAFNQTDTGTLLA